MEKVMPLLIQRTIFEKLRMNYMVTTFMMSPMRIDIDGISYTSEKSDQGNV